MRPATESPLPLSPRKAKATRQTSRGAVAHRRLEYQHALRGIAYLRMLAGERSPSTPIGEDRWDNELIPDYPPITDAELEQLKARIEELGHQGG